MHYIVGTSSNIRVIFEFRAPWILNSLPRRACLPPLSACFRDSTDFVNLFDRSLASSGDCNYRCVILRYDRNDTRRSDHRGPPKVLRFFCKFREAKSRERALHVCASGNGKIILDVNLRVSAYIDRRISDKQVARSERQLTRVFH